MNNPNLSINRNSLGAGLNKNYEKKQKRITVNFRLLKDEEMKLYDWLKENGAVGGDSAFIKSILYKEYKKSLEE